MEKDTQELIQNIYSKNHASNKQCSECVYYIHQYKDNDKVRPACGFAGNYSFVSHNPARLCNYYEKKVR